MSIHPDSRPARGRHGRGHRHAAPGCLRRQGRLGRRLRAPARAAATYTVSASTPKPSKDIDSFTWSLYAEPSSLAFPYAFDYPPNTVLANVCESLLRLNPDLSVSPGLASAVENPDPTTWVYTIREGVTFHDGTPLTADDVVASLSMHLDPKVGSFWVAAYRNVKSIEKTGDMQVTVTLSKPDSMWNQNMAATPGTIESAAFLAKSGADYGNPSTGVNCTGRSSSGSGPPGRASPSSATTTTGTPT